MGQITYATKKQVAIESETVVHRLSDNTTKKNINYVLLYVKEQRKLCAR